MGEHPSGWVHTLLADHLSSSSVEIEQQEIMMIFVCICAGTSVGDVIAGKSKLALHTVMALQAFYVEDQLFFFQSNNAPKLMVAVSNYKPN